MQTVKINTSSPYEVFIGRGILNECGGIFAKTVTPRRAAVITDDNVAPLYLKTVTDSLSAAGFDVVSYVFPHGEENKNISTLSGVLEFLAESSVTRSDVLVALGGGVVGDTAGFAAAVYQRGIKFFQIPTTLLAAVDSSVGGKTAVDLAAGKNMAGAFHQPSCVVCDTDAFFTLTDEFFADGLAESVKYAVLTDRALFDTFCMDIDGEIEEIVAKCVKIKADYVERDEFDNGDRRFLNLGHTFGHAIERLSGFTLSHGHAVAIGTVMMARAGEKMGLTRTGVCEELIKMYQKNRLPVSSPYSADEIFEAAKGDKKRSGGNICIVMIKDIGECFLRTLAIEDLRDLAHLGKEQ